MNSSPLTSPGYDLQGKTPIWSIWWCALIFWAFTFTMTLTIGVFRYPSLEPFLPQSLYQALLINTPIISESLTLVFMYVFVTGLGNRRFLKTLNWGFQWNASLEIFGKKRQIRFASILLGLVAATLVIFVMNGLMTFIPRKETNFDTFLHRSLLIKYAVSLSAVLMAPIVEELLYRGVIFGALQKSSNTIIACLVVVSLFTFIHVPQYSDAAGNPVPAAVLSVLTLSIVCTGLRAYTNRLAPAYFAHMFCNFYVAITYYFNYDPVLLLFKKIAG
jgi:membrane protease YdiL (CAAX protease family)